MDFWGTVCVGHWIPWAQQSMVHSCTFNMDLDLAASGHGQACGVHYQVGGLGRLAWLGLACFLACLDPCPCHCMDMRSRQSCRSGLGGLGGHWCGGLSWGPCCQSSAPSLGPAWVLLLSGSGFCSHTAGTIIFVWGHRRQVGDKISLSTSRQERAGGLAGGRQRVGGGGLARNWEVSRA